MGPSGNGLVGADERRAKNSAESRAYRMGAPVRFQKAVSGSKEKRRGEAPIGAPVRVMDRLLPSDEGTGPTARRPRCGDPHSACRRFAPSDGGTFPAAAGRTLPRNGETHPIERQPRHACCTPALNRTTTQKWRKAFWRNEPEDEADSILAERTREFRAALFRAGRYDPSQPLKGI